jgi:hypothetical protein
MDPTIDVGDNFVIISIQIRRMECFCSTGIPKNESMNDEISGITKEQLYLLL